MSKPFFGYHMPLFTFPGVPDDQLFEHLVRVVQAAEQAGFDMVTVMDHFYQIRGVGPEEAPMLEAYTLLGALAARTSRVRLGTMVSGVTYRNPALLAKMVTTLDIVSGGRAVLGLGAAWNEDEHKGYGFEFPPMRERMDRLEEALEICHLMFTQDRPSFEGTYYRIDRALDSPRPIQPGGPRILIGGSGERRTLRMLARFGDIANWFGGLDELKHKDEVFLAHCEAVGRDPSTVLRTVMAPVLLVADVREAESLLAHIPPERRASLIAATPARAAEALAPYREAGFDGFILRNPMLSTVESMALAGELIAAMQ
ncbi:MAG TPA: LLM class F420-dependent oxidoreductase [Candidatus Sulfotelmatobacter sp.]|nr:LLM class F420-dependent oxidoreductase [Candidatus Sulfotelmatobacter sp.]